MYCVGWSKLRVRRPQEGGGNVLCWLVKTTGSASSVMGREKCVRLGDK